MPRTARRAALAALTALAAVAAIITANFTPPAQAQSNDETTGRIVARLLDDGRVEFGWQPTGGERVLPRQRYFPNDITHNRWLRSSPVEVGGAEIGRINARQTEDGRIEFAFTPTDGERITPQARYFPADARVGRWLRSTEIAIGPAAPRYTAVSAGSTNTCGLRESGEIECWGDNRDGQNDAPDGRFTAVSSGVHSYCAIRTSGEIVCWGTNRTPPPGNYTAVSGGTNHACGLRESGEIACWGANETYAGFNEETQENEWVSTGQATPPDGRFTAISAGFQHTCAIRTSGAIECWGDNRVGQSDTPDGAFTAVSTGRYHTCAIRERDSAIECWGQNGYPWETPATGETGFTKTGQTDAPEGSFTTVSTGTNHNCAIRTSGEIACWGDNDVGQSDAPDGTFTAVSAGGSHSCGLRESGEITCWGNNYYGEATPPTD